MPLITMPTPMTAILVALFLCVTLYVLAGREVATDFVRCIAGTLVRQVRAMKRRKRFSAGTAEEATGG